MKPTAAKTILATLIGFTWLISIAVSQDKTPDENELLSFLRTDGKDPQSYVIEKFKTYDIVLLGEDHHVQQNLLFVQSLIPALYKAGVRAIGMEFGASEDQERLDSLVGAPEYSEAVARQIMFSYNVAWAWKEYMDIYRRAWEFNRTLPPGAKRFRILNISYRYNWEGFEGKRTPDNMAKVFYKGTIDKYRAELIEHEIVRKKEKLLALVGTAHAYTKYASAEFRFNNDNFCSYDDNWLGNRLYKKFPGKIFNILLHQPFPNKTNHQPWLVSPAHGVIEKLFSQLNNTPLGFDLLHSPVGKLRDDSQHSMGYDHFRLEQFFDGYVFLAPFSQLRSCTIDEQFVTGQNIETALKQSPDPDWHGRQHNLEEFRQLIHDMADIEKRYATIGNP